MSPRGSSARGFRALLASLFAEELEAAAGEALAASPLLADAAANTLCVCLPRALGVRGSLDKEAGLGLEIEEEEQNKQRKCEMRNGKGNGKEMSDVSICSSPEAQAEAAALGPTMLLRRLVRGALLAEREGLGDQVQIGLGDEGGDGLLGLGLGGDDAGGLRWAVRGEVKGEEHKKDSHQREEKEEDDQIDASRAGAEIGNVVEARGLTYLSGLFFLVRLTSRPCL